MTDPMLPEFLAQIPPEEPIGLAPADGAYDAPACHSAIPGRQAKAVIRTRRNGQPWKETTTGAQASNDVLRATKRLGRTSGAPGADVVGSRIEAKTRGRERPGERFMARTFEHRTTERHVRAALLNRFTRRGTPETQRAA